MKAVTQQPIDLLALTLDELKAFVCELGEKPYRALQLFQAFHGQGKTHLDQVSNISREFRACLSEAGLMPGLEIDAVHKSSDGTRKYQFKTHDGHTIESVYIPNASAEGRNTICISSQVGCAMGCTFCATAAMNLTRHLTASEIVSQIYLVQHDLRQEIASDSRLLHNIVYMGMGEPLHNYDNVVRSIKLLTAEHGQQFSSRRITVSTSGVVKNIVRLGNDTDVHIAISLNATTNDVRNDIMPVNQKWDIAALLEACKAFPMEARRRITFEYVLLAGINDSDDDAKRLVKLLRDFRCKVNLIPFNAHPLSPFKRPEQDRVLAFQGILQDRHMSAFIRTTRGDDVDAACGMLGAKKLADARGSLPIIMG